MTAPKGHISAAAALVVLFVGVLVFQFTRKPPSPPVAPKTAATKTATREPAAHTAASPTASAAKPAASAAAAKAAPGGRTEIKKADVNIDELLAGIKEVDFDYDKERLSRDPMMPLVGTLTKAQTKGEEGAAPEGTVQQATPVTVMNKVVSGIVWDAKRPLAIVDNDIVYPGYTYADGTVVEAIERDHVVFRVGDSLIQVQLKEL
jgi:hypothetical protein